jgi:hypothetical protein
MGRYRTPQGQYRNPVDGEVDPAPGPSPAELVKTFKGNAKTRLRSFVRLHLRPSLGVAADALFFQGAEVIRQRYLDVPSREVAPAFAKSVVLRWIDLQPVLAVQQLTLERALNTEFLRAIPRTRAARDE